MTSLRPLLARTAAHAADFLEGLDERVVAPQTTLAELRAALGGPLPEHGRSAERVIDELVRDADEGILASAGGRFFGRVIGGGVPAALAADWLTSTWDQNAALYACGPAAAVAEEVAGEWLKELLALPREASFALTTGTQMAHATALASARGKLLAERGFDAERQGLAEAPRINVLVGGRQHGSIERAVRLLGIGTDAITAVGTDERDRLDLAGLERALVAGAGAPTIVCLQAGEINTGAFDPFAEAVGLAREHRAWVHVDGAFGLWAAVSDRLRPLLAGVDGADSWTTDGHKWLNVPFDSGFAFVRHPGAHRAAMTITASYLVKSDDDAAEPGRTSVASARDQIDWTPDWSRRGRGFAAYAAIRSLGREGIRAIVESCSDHAHRLTCGIAALPGAELLVEPQINQGLVRFLAADGDHDGRTEEVIASVQATGEAWFGGVTWNGMRAMRISVVNWQTSARDVDRALAVVGEALSSSR